MISPAPHTGPGDFASPQMKAPMRFLDDTRIPEQRYRELRSVLSAFVNDVAAELGENLVGIYLVGSIASGDFDADSDVDFLVVTNTELTEANQKGLQKVQRKIHDLDGYPAKHLEGSYISIHDLNDWNVVGEKKLYYFDNGSTAYEYSAHDNQWHVRWILRERGITLVGPNPKTILQAVPLEKMHDEIMQTMLLVVNLFQDELDRPLSFWNSRFGQSFAVLTCCRMLHTLRTGIVQSKKAGAEWAKERVEPRWRELIDQAWHEREGVRFGIKIGQRAQPARLLETLEFMRYAVAQVR
jgi:predicted nucleotidyltransferase